MISKNKEMIYLASAYSHKADIIRWYRFYKNCRVAAKLMKKGLNIFSPIAFTHIVAAIGKLPQMDHDFWLSMDYWYVKNSRYIYVLNLRGWQKSRGVTQELIWAREMGKEVYLINKKGEILERIN